jgi:predicted RecA/RadA family phage recombinase
MYSLGSNTKNTFLAVENGKIALEFEAAADVKKGQPVKLTAAGKVTPWASADTKTFLLGVAHKDAATGELVTVVTRGYALINALSAAAINPGPVTYSSYDSSTSVNGTTGYSKYNATATDAERMAFNLTVAAGADALIQVLIMD